jgi:outer membrane protein OmpA-like peptidoglycan-associated protein
MHFKSFIIILGLFSVLNSSIHEGKIAKFVKFKNDYYSQPVVDANITLKRDNQIFTTTSNKQGYFIFRNLPHGYFKVKIEGKERELHTSINLKDHYDRYFLNSQNDANLLIKSLNKNKIFMEDNLNIIKLNIKNISSTALKSATVIVNIDNAQLVTSMYKIENLSPDSSREIIIEFSPYSFKNKSIQLELNALVVDFLGKKYNYKREIIVNKNIFYADEKEYVVRNNHRIKNIPSNIVFKKNSYEIENNAHTAFMLFALDLKKQLKKDDELYLFGYASNLESLIYSKKYNKELSKQRAEYIKYSLISYGIENKITTYKADDESVQNRYKIIK